MTNHVSLRAVAVAVTTLALGAGPLRAQNTSVDSSFAVRGTARLSIQSQSGTVNVRVWNRPQIRVQAESDRARVEFDATSGQVTARTVTRRGNSEVDYRISVPSGTAIEVNGLSLDVGIAGVCGPVNITTLSGDISVRCIEGDGVFSSISGDMTIADTRGALDISATSGSLDLRNARGPVKAHTVSGDVHLEDIAAVDVDVETVSGDLGYSGRILDNGRYRFSAHSGDVTLHVEGNPSATFSVSTFSGDFESDFPIELLPGTRVSREWQFRLGAGSARVKLGSFSGTINLRRGSSGGPRDK